MKLAAAALLSLLAQDAKKDLKEACAATAKAKSYSFTLKVTVGGEEKLSAEGEYFAPGLLHVRTGKAETARSAEGRWVKRGEEWREAKLGPKGEDVNAPHEWARKIAEMCPALKKEKSSKIGGTTVDLYVHSLAHDQARKSLEAGGLPLWANSTDWTKTQNGVVFSIGRDDLLYRVEQRFDGRSKDDKKVDNAVVLEFSEFGKAACRLPAEVREKLGGKGD